MLNNLILDIGNVICDWNPDWLAASAFDDDADRAEALAVTVQTPDWLSLDKGEMTVDEAIYRAQARTSLSPAGIEKIYDNLCTSLKPLQGTIDAMERAHAQGVPIYVLSNMQAHAWEYLQNTYDCWQYCEGFVISCDIGLIKPDPAIYAHLCAQFSVSPESCLFIDDMATNIEAAKAYGMQGIQLTDKHGGGAVVDEVVTKIVASREG